ncbi:MarR family winged helix-turn-helix transcriptional regulator [Streptococcus sciuri]|uniref:MarR family transcriptional regulator n=1 Tax=Streptococcus sciuri TaxID=2973939 RepID=A0ABT2F5L5_9STRE|nr:MarR family transcriptional regulator [Streptococcus sciuri]MCS4487763.1 MarR family transcriptional regulator [Streptococcus sciuri]
MEGIELFHQVMCVYKKNLAGASQVLAEHDITVAQMDVLCTLSRMGPQTQQELANHAQVTKGNMAQILAKMEKSDLVSRTQNQRSKEIRLTEKSRELYAAILPALETYHENFFVSLSGEEKVTLHHLLKKIK